MLKKLVSMLIMFFCLNVNADMNNIKPANYQSFYDFYKYVLGYETYNFVFKDDYDGLLSIYIMTIQSDSLIDDYKENESIANNKYKGKLIRIKTIASTIGEHSLTKSHITANGKNSNESIQLFLKDKNDNSLLSLSKGDKIDLICIGGGMSLGSPVLEDCEFVNTYLNNFRASALHQIKEIENEHYQSASRFEARCVAFYKVYEKGIASECQKSSKQCGNAILKATEDESYYIEQAKQHYDSALRELGRYTEKIPDLPYPENQN